MSSILQSITLAGGCFWCTEAVFKRVRGVTEVQSGYANGDVADPSYEQVCSGHTGHAEAVRIGQVLREETVGGALLVVMAVIALVWANSPWAEGYFALRDFRIGYEPWHLNLTLGGWAADGLLAIFFFLIGLELKREFVAGDLRRQRHTIGADRPALRVARLETGRRSMCRQPAQARGQSQRGGLAQ